LGGFDIDPEDSRPMWEEAIALLPKMGRRRSSRGNEGKYLKMPPREVIPKPIQKPHPPLWVAATQTEHVGSSGTKGIGALGFGISAPGILDALVGTYKKALKDCEPVGKFVNDRVACGTIAVARRRAKRRRRLRKTPSISRRAKARSCSPAFRQQGVEGDTILQDDGAAKQLLAADIGYRWRTSTTQSRQAR